MAIRELLLLVGIGLTVACASVGYGRGGGRGPAAEVNERMAGGLSDDEASLCSELDCHHFIAPCSLHDRNKEKVLSAMDEVYLNEAETHTARGFCAEPPRRLTGEGYSKETCLYLFVKRDRCG